jgi:hypothetical protein
MLIAPAQGIGMFEEGHTGVEVFSGVYAGATGTILSISSWKVWLQLDPYTGEAPCPYHVPYFCSLSPTENPQLVHIYLTSLMAPPDSRGMAPDLEEENRVRACYGCHEGYNGSVVRVSEKMVTVRFDHMLWREVRVMKTMVALLEEEDEGPPAPFPVLVVPRSVVHGGRPIPFAHLPVANAISP